MNVGEELVRTCAANRSLRISKHAYQRMKERCISVEQVYDTVSRGIILERQDLERDLKLVFQENVHNSVPTFYVVVACRIPPVVVSVILFEEEKWEFKDGRMWRRR